ncbi:50S ribosomal protein L5, partial [candidate division MSBL1 archaeon SCGC-AAA382C18]
NAEDVLEKVAGQTPVRTEAEQTNQTLEIREGTPIGCKVTLRGESAIETLEKLLGVVGNEIKESSFDKEGNFAFGIDEHIEIPEMEYDPDMGIFGMDVVVNLVRPGFSIRKRRRESKTIPKSHRINKEEAIEFVKQKFDVKVV